MKRSCITLLLLTAPAFAQGPLDLPEPAPRPAREVFLPAPAPEGAIPLPQATAFTAVRPDISVLDAARVGDRLTLTLTPNVSLTLLVTRFERRADNEFAIGGRLDGFADSSVNFAVVDDAVACDITAAPATLHYKTKYAADGVHLLCEMDDDQYAPCAGGKPGDVPGLDEDWVPEVGEEMGGLPEVPQPVGACSAPQTVFDIMIVYTDVARAAAGGTAAIQAEIALAIDRTNEAYQNSPISARMRLVRRYELVYNEVGTYYDHLDRLSGTNGQGAAAPWTTTRSNRDTYNADFCSLWVADGQFCGLGWCTAADNRAYTIVTWHCAAGGLTQAHEVGHNQGCDHDPDNETPGCAAYSYSYGHRFFGSDGVQYRTVMSYSPGSRIPYFSNPSQTYLGTATGTATRDNETTIDNRRGTCESFEATRWDIWIDFNYSGVEAGLFSLPYNTMPEGVTNIDDWVTGASEYPNLYIKEGSTNWTGTISKEMTISPCGGIVTIGD